MKYFIDTEFIEKGAAHPLQLISIGIVDDRGRELYAENSECDWRECPDWVIKNVVPHLTGPRLRLSTIVQEIRRFVDDKKPEFWGYYSAYDWVIFCQLFGIMIDLPKGWPMYCRDLKQWCDMLGNPKLPKEGYVFGKLIQKGSAHHALSDARWNMAMWHFLAIEEQNHACRTADD